MEEAQWQKLLRKAECDGMRKAAEIATRSNPYIADHCTSSREAALVVSIAIAREILAEAKKLEDGK